MSANSLEINQEGPAHVQTLLTTLNSLADPAARAVARDLVQAVVTLHGAALADLLAIVREAGAQPADTLLTKFGANPKVSGVLLLHDLHPQDLPARVRQAVEHLRPHLGVQGVRADLVSAQSGIVRISVSATGQHHRRPPIAELHREIAEAVLGAAPDLVDLVIDNLEVTSAAQEIYVAVPIMPARTALTERPTDTLHAAGA